MASKKFQEIELVNAAGDKRTATTPAQYAQYTFDGFYVDDDAEVKARLESAAVEADKPAASEAPTAPKPPVKAGGSAPGEKTAGSNPA